MRTTTRMAVGSPRMTSVDTTATKIIGAGVVCMAPRTPPSARTSCIALAFGGLAIRGQCSSADARALDRDPAGTENQSAQALENL
jgi:hypothetical protein